MTAQTRRRADALLAMLLLLAAGVARAQAPRDGRDVLRLLAGRGHIYRTLNFVQTTKRPGQPDATWYESCELPGRLRIDIAPLDSQRVIIFKSDSVMSTRLGQPVRRGPFFHGLLYLLADVFVMPAESSAAILAAHNFDLSKLHEDTWQGRPVWVVGAAAGDSTSPQFWVDLERLYVSRLIDRAGGPQGGTSDARMLQHEQVDGVWVEKEIQFLVNGVEQQRELYNEIRVNTPFEAGLFDIEPYHRPAWIRP